MISVAAIRMQQFGVQFYQASLTANDIDKLVRFEVLELRRAGQAPVRGGKKQAAQSKIQLGSARAAHRVEREGLSAAHHPAQDRRARPVLRTVPAGAGSAVDSRRRHHLRRRKALVRAGRGREHRGPAEGARARRRSARDRRPASPAGPARRHRELRRRAVHGARDHLRPSARRSRRADVRDDQREAHAAQFVAPGVAVRPSALSR